MKFEREYAETLSAVTEKELRRQLKSMTAISKSKIAILTAEDGSYVQLAGGGMTCCLEWRDARENRQMRAYQNPPVVPWPGTTRIPCSAGEIILEQNEFFRIDQVIEALCAFLKCEPFPEYIMWSDMTERLRT